MMGPALMAVWSKTLSVRASCLSPLPGSKISAGACEKVASDLGLGGGFRRVNSNSKFQIAIIHTLSFQQHEIMLYVLHPLLFEANEAPLHHSMGEAGIADG